MGTKDKGIERKVWIETGGDEGGVGGRSAKEVRCRICSNGIGSGSNETELVQMWKDIGYNYIC